MKKLLLGLLVICVLVSTGYYVWTQEKLIQSQSIQIQTKEKEIEGLKLAVYNVVSTSEKDKYLHLQEVASLQDKLKNTQDSLRSSLLEVKSLQDKFMCPEKIDWNVDYSSARTVNESLIKWVEEYYSVDSSNYHAIWNDSKTSWHELRSLSSDGYIAFYYLVYYEEKESGYVQGIYSVGLQCYIN